jgi:alpha-glucosidase
LAWADLSVEAEAAEDGSTLNLYRDALAQRRTLAALGDGTLRWLSFPVADVPPEKGAPPERLRHPAPAPDALAFARDAATGTVVCVANLGATPVVLPAGLPAPVVASGPLGPDGALPADTTAWFVLTDGDGPDGWTIT